MSSTRNTERGYAEFLWSQLEESKTTQIVTPPNQPDMKLPLEAMTEFDRLPAGEELVHRLGQIPHAVLNLGEGALLALATDIRRPEAIRGSMQRVIALEFDENRELTYDEVLKRGLGIGRGWVNGETREPDLNDLANKSAILYREGPSNWKLRGALSQTEVKVALQVTPEPQADPVTERVLYVPHGWEL